MAKLIASLGTIAALTWIAPPIPFTVHLDGRLLLLAAATAAVIRYRSVQVRKARNCLLCGLTNSIFLRVMDQ